MAKNNTNFIWGPDMKLNRKWLGIKQKTLAEIMGISQSSLSLIESGKCNPSLSAFLKMKETCNFNMEGKEIEIPIAKNILVENGKLKIDFGENNIKFLSTGINRENFYGLFAYPSLVDDNYSFIDPWRMYEIHKDSDYIEYGEIYLLFHKENKKLTEGYLVKYLTTDLVILHGNAFPLEEFQILAKQL